MFEDYVPGQLQEVFNSPDTCEQLTPKSNETKKTKKKKKKEKDDESGKSKAKSTTEEEGGTQDGSELDGQVKERGKTTKKAESKSKNKKKGGRKHGKENGGGKSSVGGLQEERSSLSDKKDQGDDDNDDVEGLGSADTTNRETATESHKKKKKKQRKKQGKGNNEVKKKEMHLKRKEEEEDGDDEDETNKKETMADQDPEAEASTIQKKKNKKDKNKKAKGSSNKDINERERRTIFVGNVPVSMKKAELRAIFKVFGFIESIRLRSIGFKDPSVPRMVALSKKQFHDRRHSMNAYVVFVEEKAAESALEANGHKVTAKVTNPSKRGGEEGGAVEEEEEEEDFYLRVDRASGPKTSVDNSKSIFVGNLPYDAQENDVRRHFQGCGEIINVRLIRDRRLNVGKGFGYVSFRTKSAATTARLLHETEFRGRKLRVFASTDKPKKPASSSSPAPATGKKGRAAEKNRKGFERRTKKRKGVSSDASDANKKHKFSGEYSSKKDAEARLKRKKKKQKHQQRKKKFLRNNSGQSNKRPRQKSNA
mmetsp:Transcript_7338/g.11582  ORF Transcript_7338/g.11582 Transcript_7338/m.11582 type:complete len:537 (-) Transcript_7338:85-1695(-)